MTLKISKYEGHSVRKESMHITASVDPLPTSLHIHVIVIPFGLVWAEFCCRKHPPKAKLLALLVLMIHSGIRL